MSVYICVEQEALEHMSYQNLCVENEALIKLEVLGINPRAFHVDVEHKLSNIRSLAIVSLGVSYKYTLELVLS